MGKMSPQEKNSNCRVGYGNRDDGGCGKDGGWDKAKGDTATID